MKHTPHNPDLNAPPMGDSVVPRMDGSGSPRMDVERLSKRFGSLLAVDNLSFRVKQGEIVGLLGVNGAGKTTTMRILAGADQPDHGNALINGLNLSQNPAARSMLGYMPEGAPSWRERSVSGVLSFLAAAHGLQKTHAQQAVARVVDMTSLHEVLAEPVGALSRGFQRRVAIAQALVHDPPCLILDEPTDGLDPLQKQHMRNVVTSMRSSKAILISTHILEEVDAVCDRAVIIGRGRLLADQSPQKLKEQANGSLHDAFVSLAADADKNPPNTHPHQ